MNVRFFAGTKADYLSLPAPRNPLGLYFCSDTKELFWADRLLTDGIRVVPTFSDLPSILNAADGVMYYVTETRNGYTLAPDRSKWLQTIYAPATDAYQVPESEIYNTVTTVGAVRDIEAKIYKTIEEKIVDIEIGAGVDLDNYYTKSEVDDKIPDVSCFVTDEALAEKGYLTELPEHTHDEYLTELPEHTHDQYLTEHQSLAEYAKKGDLFSRSYNDLTDKPEIPVVPTNVSAFTNDAGYLTVHQDISGKADVDHKHDDLYEAKGAVAALKDEILNGAGDAFDTLKELGELITSNVDAISALETVATGKADKDHTHDQYLTEQGLSDYAKRSDLFSKDYNDLVNKPTLFSGSYNDLSDKPEAYDDSELRNLINNKADAEHSHNNYASVEHTHEAYYTKTEVDTKIPSLDGYATEDFVTKAIEAIQLPETNLDDYYTKDEVNTVIAAIDIPSVEGLASEQFVLDKIDTINIPSTDGFATENYVTEKIAEIEIPDVTNFATKDELPVVEGLASESFVEEKIAEIAIPSIVGLATEDYVDEAIANISIPSVDGLASEQFVKDEIGKIIIPEATDLSNYYDKDEINAKFENIEHPTVSFDGYATETWVSEQGFVTEEALNAKGYLTEVAEHTHTISEITDYEAPVIPSLEGYATEKFVTDAIADIALPEVPEVNLDNYYTKEETTSAIAEAVAEIKHPTTDLSGYALKTEVAAKANEIPFTEDKYVTNAIGNFTAGESVKGLSIADILAKLLGLSDAKPDEPDEPKGIIETIIDDEIVMYEIDENDVMIEVPFSLIDYTESEVSTVYDKQTGFYRVLNTEGEIVEAGYQHFTDSKIQNYIVALPENLSVTVDGNVELQSWNEIDKVWAPARYVLTDDYDRIAAAYAEFNMEPPTVPDGYKLWADLSMQDPGTSYRFIIKE